MIEVDLITLAEFLAASHRPERHDPAGDQRQCHGAGIGDPLQRRRRPVSTTSKSSRPAPAPGRTTCCSPTRPPDDHGDDATGGDGDRCRRRLMPGDLETLFDTDWFSFNAVAGTEYKMQTILGTLTDSVIRLYDSDGITVLASSDNAVGLESFIRWTALADGTYFVEVDGEGRHVDRHLRLGDRSRRPRRRCSERDVVGWRAPAAQLTGDHRAVRWMSTGSPSPRRRARTTCSRRRLDRRWATRSCG